MPKKVESNFWSTVPGIISAIAGLVAAVAGLLGVLWGQGFLSGKRDNSHVIEIEPQSPTPMPMPMPYGIELTALTDAANAVLATEQVKTIAPKGASIRLYKRRTNKGTIAWAPVVLYTDSTVASTDRHRYEVNDWDPELVTISTWCPNPRPIPSPTGVPLSIPVLDCT